jgi:hypothetical protein
MFEFDAFQMRDFYTVVLLAIKFHFGVLLGQYLQMAHLILFLGISIAKSNFAFL